jgi:hypothetical protein
MTTFLLFAALLSGGSPSVPAEPVKVSIAVAPTPSVPGQDAAVTVTLQPSPGIKLNKYPKIKLVVAAAPGVVAAAEGSIGASRPPASDQAESNYYKGSVDPLVVNLPVDPAASSGKHDVPGRLSYFYCVAASGYCAPAKVDVSIPITVR